MKNVKLSKKHYVCLILSLILIVHNFSFPLLKIRAEESAYQVTSYYPNEWYIKRWQPASNEAGGFWVPGIGPNSTVPDGPDQFYPSLHFHNANDGIIAYCMQSDLTNPDGTTNYTNVSSLEISQQFGSDRLFQVSNILKRGYPLGGNLGLPEDAAREATQIAIWNVLSGTVGNESNLWGNLDLLENNNANIPTLDKVKWLIQESTKPVEHEITITCENESKDVNYFYYDLTILVTEMSKGIKLSFENLPEKSMIDDHIIENQFEDPSATNGVYQYRLKIPRLNNENRILEVKVEGLDERDSADMYFYQTSENYDKLPYQMLAVAVRTQKEYDGNKIEIATGDNFGDIRVLKKDLNNNHNLSGAVFGLFLDEKATNLYTLFPATNEEGETSLLNIKPGVYYLKEMESPFGYKIDGNVNKVTIQPDTVTELTIHNEQEKNKIIIKKVDELNQKPLHGAVYDIFEDEQCTKFISTLKETDELGITESELLPYGIYYVKEKIAPSGYYLSGDIIKVEISSSTTPIQLTATNKKITGKIKVKKSGEQLIRTENLESSFGMVSAPVFEQVSLEGVVFSVFKDPQCLDMVGQIHTDENGNGEFAGLDPGIYYIKETMVPDGFVLLDEVFTYEVKPEGEGEHKLELENQRGSTKVNIYKSGKGEEILPLRDVVFGIYNAEPWIGFDGEKVLNKNQLISVIRTDSEGVAVLQQKLPLGKYYFKELETPDGFVPSNEIYKFEITSTGQKETLLEYNKENPIINEQAYGKLTVHKTDEYNNPIEEVAFTFTCTDNGEKYFLNTNEEGNAVLDNVPIGSIDKKNGNFMYYTYELEETTPKEGFEQNNETYTIQFKQSDKKEKVVEYNLEVINKRIPSKIFILGIDDYYQVMGISAISVGLFVTITGMIVYKKRSKH